MQFNLTTILLLFLVFQLLLIGIFLFTKNTGRPISNRLLGLFFVLLGIALGDNFLLKTGYYLHHPFLADWSLAFPLAYGPLILLYTSSLLQNDFKIGWRRLSSLLPFVVLFLTSIVCYALQPPATKLLIITSANSHQVPVWSYLLIAALAFHFFWFARKALLLIIGYRLAAANRFSNPAQVNLRWLSSTIYFFIGLFFLSLINNLLEIKGLSAFQSIALLSIIASLFVFINRVLLMALQQPALFSWEPEPAIAEKQLKTASPAFMAQAAILENLMEKQRPYLQPELSVESLAKMVALRPKELSQLINEHYNQNFFDFVNQYRIEAAKQMLKNPTDSKTTVLEVLYQVGFNSKSSFNTLFKKYTGLTPTEFKNRTDQ